MFEFLRNLLGPKPAPHIAPTSQSIIDKQDHPEQGLKQWADCAYELVYSFYWQRQLFLMNTKSFEVVNGKMPQFQQQCKDIAEYVKFLETISEIMAQRYHKNTSGTTTEKDEFLKYHTQLTKLVKNANVAVKSLSTNDFQREEDKRIAYVDIVTLSGSLKAIKNMSIQYSNAARYLKAI